MCPFIEILAKYNELYITNVFLSEAEIGYDWVSTAILILLISYCYYGERLLASGRSNWRLIVAERVSVVMMRSKNSLNIINYKLNLQLSCVLLIF